MFSPEVWGSALWRHSGGESAVCPGRERAWPFDLSPLLSSPCLFPAGFLCGVTASKLWSLCEDVSKIERTVLSTFLFVSKAPSCQYPSCLPVILLLSRLCPVVPGSVQEALEVSVYPSPPLLSSSPRRRRSASWLCGQPCPPSLPGRRLLSVSSLLHVDDGWFSLAIFFFPFNLKLYFPVTFSCLVISSALA